VDFDPTVLPGGQWFFLDTYKSGPTVLPPFSLRSMIPAMPRLSHNPGQLENLQKNRE
jgi:hypothetical protein